MFCFNLRNEVVATVLLAVAAFLGLLDVPTVCGQDITSATRTGCPPGPRGAHCLNGLVSCGVDNNNVSICIDYQCDRGWTDTPFCSIACPAGFFGPNCESECHCQEGVSCDVINGLCGNNVCDEEWTGPSCQTRKPRLMTPPRTVSVTCREVVITWPQWSPDTDIGTPPVGSYRVDYRENNIEWTFYRTVQAVPEVRNYTLSIGFLDPDSIYHFRVTANRMDNGKTQSGFPGPVSQATQPDCPVPTTTPAPVTTAPSTTTTPTTTPLSTTTTPTTTTTPQSIRPQAVSRVSVTVTESGSVSIRWEPPRRTYPAPREDAPSAYNITYRRLEVGDCGVADLGRPVTVILPVNTLSYTLEGLDGWRVYSVKISGINQAGQGSVVEKKFTMPPVAPSGKIEQVNHRDVTSSSAVITWSEMPCTRRGSSIANYAVYIRDAATGRRVTAAGTNTLDVKVGELRPFTQYTAEVVFSNGVSETEPSDTHSFQTAEGPPSAPTRIVVTNYTATTISITWDAPVPTNGVVIMYRVLYRSNADSEVTRSVTQNADEEGPKVVPDLDPYTEYIIQVQARTGALQDQGWGALSDPVAQVTWDGVPGAPRDLHRTERNQTCISLKWTPPAREHGVLRKYMVSYDVVAVSSATSPTSFPGIELSSTILQYTACKLHPAVQYRFKVSASSRASYGPAATLEVWTEIGTPPPPPKPTVRNITATHVTVVLQPIVPATGPVSAYFVIIGYIEDLRKRRRRSLQGDPIDVLKVPGYTAAMFERTELTKARQFIIGDNKTYGGYRNRPLSKESDYDLYFMATSSLDGITKLSYAQTEITTNLQVVTLYPTPATTEMTTPMTTEEPVTEATRGSNASALYIGVGVAALIFLTVLIILIIIFCKCRRPKEQDDLKATWLDYYTKNYINNTLPKSKRGNWSDIHELNESRHVTIHDERTYSPEDLRVADIQNNKPTISFEEEYGRLRQGQCHPCNVAIHPENQEKNRFERLLAYDHSRVVLKKKRGQAYINANFIQGYHVRAAYIAAQGPFNDATMEDFWTMVYQQRASQIVFMCRLVEDGITKSEQYWPTTGLEHYGDVSVRHVKTDEFAHFVVRVFDVKGRGGSSTLRVSQYQFTAWPDHGVPQDPIPFLDFRMKVKTSVTNEDAPVLVHCGTGVSRTAVFIAVDCLLEQAKLENAVNVFKFVERMRRDRTMMVRTLKQYSFIYDVLFEALITNYNIVGDDLRVNYRLLSYVNPLTDKSHFREQFEVLEEFVPQLPQERCIAGLREQNLKKNRFETILPSDEFRPILKSSRGIERSDYINATYIDTYTQRKAFIVTQTPIQSTIVDFWRLVSDYKINTIVMLNNSDFKEDSCAQYWPQRPGVEKYEPFFVKLTHVSNEEHFTIRNMQLSNSQRPAEAARKVRQFQFESWRMYEKVPWSRDGFMRVMEKVDLWREKTETLDRPVLVHCMDGASQSGLYCACFVLCEKMIIEGEVDVFHTIKNMKRRRPHFVNTLEQYKFCFKLLWDYMNTRMRGLGRTEENGYVNASYNPDADDEDLTTGSGNGLVAL